MKKVFICSPYKGDVEGNTRKAKHYARIVAQCNVVPIAPHLYFPTFLDEENPNERMLGISLGLELMHSCDEVWLLGFTISDGMKLELEKAKELKLPIRLYDKEMNRVNVATLPVDNRADIEYKAIIKGLKLLK